ncbi:MAG: Gx transporter family protein [Spirochaetales bacterium]|nr:Gx transporter family protein [Spirochaetales bacterium]
MKINEKDFTASLAAMSAFLSIFESFIPTPVPFLRLGLANIPICLALPFIQLKNIFFIVSFKLLFTHLFRGTLFSFPFFAALGGSLFFLFFVLPFFKIMHKRISFISVSLFGAIGHNLGQLTAALFFIPFNILTIIALVMLPIGVITGVINGIICNYFYKRLTKNNLISISDETS